MRHKNTREQHDREDINMQAYKSGNTGKEGGPGARVSVMKKGRAE